MWTHVWPLADLQQLDREARKISENGGNHPQGSSAMMYLFRKYGGKGMQSVEREYMNTKIKTAVKLFSNPDPGMATVRSFEAKAVQSGRHPIIKENGNEHDWRREVSTVRQRTRERATHLGRLLCACAN